MYVVDSLDRVVEVGDVPQHNSGAPLPFVMSDERIVLLAYMVADSDHHNWMASVQTVTPDSRARVALVEFRRPLAQMFGPPNDETFAGHPLADRGLRPYGVFEVEESSWVRQLDEMSGVHRHHRALRSLGLRHYIFCFHDSTFECVAHSLTADLRDGSVRDAMFEMLQRVQGP